MAKNQDVVALEDIPINITLSGSDVNQDQLTFRIIKQPDHGSLGGVTKSSPSSATVIYTPHADYNGQDSFTFKVTDDVFHSNTATVNITVQSLPDNPVAHSLSISTNEDAPLNITLSGSDADGDSLTFSILSQPLHGSLGSVTSAGTSSVTVDYTPDADYNGQDSFTFKVNGGFVDSSAATVTMTVVSVNDPPAAQGQSLLFGQDAPQSITLSGSDIEGDALAFSIVSQPDHGSLGSVTSAGNTSATVVYTPDAGYHGPDPFTFKAHDGLADSGTVTVDITVFDERFAIYAKNEHPHDYFLGELGINWFLDLSPNASDIPPGAHKVLYITVPTSPTTWSSGQVEKLDTLSDAERAALGFHTRPQIAEMAQAAPGSYWYLFGEPNRYGAMTGKRFATVFHYYYTELKNADPTAKVTSPSVLNWDFTCVGCGGYASGVSWVKEFIAEYESPSKYGTKPPVDVWAINAYPINWSHPPPSASWNSSTVIDQLEGMRQYLDTIPQYVNTPIWITEISLHVGYKERKFGSGGGLEPVFPYEWDRVSDYLITMLDWLDANSAANKIDKWFFFITWTDLVNIGGSGYMGIIFFDGPSKAASLNCLGRIYRAHALGEARVKCDVDGNTVPE